MDYISAKEAAGIWGITQRRVEVLCQNGQVQGAERIGNTWLIPKRAEKPIDGRTKAARQQNELPEYALTLETNRVIEMNKMKLLEVYHDLFRCSCRGLIIIALSFAALLSACSKSISNEETDSLLVSEHEPFSFDTSAPEGTAEADSFPVADPFIGVAPEPQDSAETGQQEAPWRDCYAELLNAFLPSDSMSFLLHDFDRDGIPELLVVGFYNDKIVDTVYTYKDGGILQLDYEEGLHIASFLLVSRARITTAPDNESGIIMYFVGPSVGVLGTSIEYERIGIDGHKLFIAAHGERYVDYAALIDLVGLYGESASDNAALYATIEEHTFLYIDDNEVAQEELHRVFESGEHLSLSHLSVENIHAELLENP